MADEFVSENSRNRSEQVLNTPDMNGHSHSIPPSSKESSLTKQTRRATRSVVAAFFSKRDGSSPKRDTP